MLRVLGNGEEDWHRFNYVTPEFWIPGPSSGKVSYGDYELRVSCDQAE